MTPHTLYFTPQATSTMTTRRQSRAMALYLHRHGVSGRRSPGGSAASWGTGCASAWEPTSTSSFRRRRGEAEVERMRWPVWTACTWSPPRSAFAMAYHPPRCHHAPRHLTAKALPTWSRGWRGKGRGGFSLLTCPPPRRFTVRSPTDRWAFLNVLFEPIIDSSLGCFAAQEDQIQNTCHPELIGLVIGIWLLQLYPLYCFCIISISVPQPFKLVLNYLCSCCWG